MRSTPLVCDSDAAHVPCVPLSSCKDRILALATRLYRPYDSLLHAAPALHEAFWSQSLVGRVAGATASVGKNAILAIGVLRTLFCQLHCLLLQLVHQNCEAGQVVKRF